MAQRLKATLLGQLDILERIDPATLLQQRYERLRGYGAYEAVPSAESTEKKGKAAKK